MDVPPVEWMPVALIRVCLRNHIVARSGQVAPSGASAISGKLCHHRRSTAIQRIDAERPAGQSGLARILESVCVVVVILANGDRACWRRGWRRVGLARRIIFL